MLILFTRDMSLEFNEAGDISNQKEILEKIDDEKKSE